MNNSIPHINGDKMEGGDEDMEEYNNMLATMEQFKYHCIGVENKVSLIVVII